MEGLAWANASGSTDLKDGDKVTFTALLYNNSGDDIPAGQSVGFKAVIDTNTTVGGTYTGGLKAGETVKVSTSGTWTAAYGGHKVVATVNDTESTLTKSFNVGQKEVTFQKSTGGYDLVVTNLEYDKASIAAGDRVLFTATVKNIGDADAPANGQPLGVRIHIDGNESVLVWNDQHTSGLKAGESVKLTMTGGSNNNIYWTATAGTHTVTAWVNDQTSRYPNEVNFNNNQTNFTITVPSPAMIENPDEPDDLDNIVIDPDRINISSSVKIEGFQISTKLGGSRVVGSVEPTINNKQVVNWGFIYAVTKAGDETFDVSDTDMFVGTTSKYAVALESTPLGTAEDVKFGSSDTATYFVRTTLFGAKTAKEYSAEYKVRAYAQLSDGTYVYSKVSSYSVYDICDTLYTNKMMNTIEDHNYLYNSILKVVNPDYKENDYNWSNTVVDPSTIG